MATSFGGCPQTLIPHQAGAFASAHPFHRCHGWNDFGHARLIEAFSRLQQTNCKAAAWGEGARRAAFQTFSVSMLQAAHKATPSAGSARWRTVQTFSTDSDPAPGAPD